MSRITIKTDDAFKDKLSSYPKHIKPKIVYLRKLVQQSAREIGTPNLEETLKWGEPSFLAKNGSTIRIDWKEKTPNQYAIYFKCTSKLVPTFKDIYKDTFNYETTRAIRFKLDEEVPVEALSHCIKMALNYHKLKHLPLLGNT